MVQFCSYSMKHKHAELWGAICIDQGSRMFLYNPNFSSIQVQQNISLLCDKCRISCSQWSETPGNTHKDINKNSFV